MSNDKMIKTDNIPLLDNVIYYLKRLATESIVKNSYNADKNETLESRKNYDEYKMCLTGSVRYEYFNYVYEDLAKTDCPVNDMFEILKDKDKAPEVIKRQLLENKKKEIIDNYDDLNNYYRMLHGMPDLEDEDIIFIDTQYLDEDDYITVFPQIPVHKMTDAQQEFLNSIGVIDIYKELYPDKKYLNYLGNKKIDYFTARNSPMFSLLYTPTDGIPMEVYTRWKEKFSRNRVFITKTIYDPEAFIEENSHYNDFIAMFIVLETMTDIIAELPDFIIKRDIFDLGMIRLVLQCYNVDYFPDIPLSYQQAIVRNINKLIEFKATGTGIVNICSLFGFDNIEVFKYYLFKERKTDEDGNFTFAEKDIDNYKFKFIKCPMDDNIDDYIHDRNMVENYDEVTIGDKWWDGGMDHKTVANMIKEREFNYLQSKYYSIEVVMSMTEKLFQLVYFYNMIFDDVFTEDLLRVRLFNLSNRYSFKLVDVFAYLFGLAYAYYGLEDELIFDTSKILYIKGFNFSVDMSELATWLFEEVQGAWELDHYGADKFSRFNKSDRIMSYHQLSDVYLNNVSIYKHVVHKLRTCNNKREYDVYKQLYDAMMIEELTSDFFVKSDGEVAKTISDYLRDKSPILYDSLYDIKKLDDEDRVQTAGSMIDDVIYVLEKTYLTDKAYEKIYGAFPTRDADSILKYLKEVIEFFKSYKMTLDKINIVYLLDDEYENWCQAIDDVLLQIHLTPVSCVQDKDNLKAHIETMYKEKILPEEELYMYITYWEGLGILDDYTIDELMSKLVYLKYLEDCKPYESLKINTYST